MNLWYQQHQSRARSPISSTKRLYRSLSEGQPPSISQSRASSSYCNNEQQCSSQVQIFRDQGRTVCTISLLGSASEDESVHTPMQKYRLPLICKKTKRIIHTSTDNM